ncbi:hypothetical protein [Agrobacterium sp. El2ro-1b]
MPEWLIPDNFHRMNLIYRDVTKPLYFSNENSAELIKGSYLFG